MIIRSGGGGGCDADGSNSGVACRSSGDGDVLGGEEGNERGQEGAWAWEDGEGVIEEAAFFHLPP